MGDWCKITGLAEVASQTKRSELVKNRRIVTVLLLSLVLAGSLSCNPFGQDKPEVTQRLVKVVRGDLIVSGSGNIAVSNEARLVFSFTKIGVA